MQIEEGKFYRTRDGRKVGPMVFSGKHGTYCWYVNDDDNTPIGQYSDSGESGFAAPWYYCDADLIAEWQDSPVKTVTRREIVPGVYGRVLVNERGDGTGLESVTMQPTLNAEELREAAHILNQIAEVLEDA